MALPGSECARCHKQTGLPLDPGLCECGDPRLPRYDIAKLRFE